MRRYPAPLAKFEPWQIDASQPGVAPFAAAVALAGLEDRWITISAADQRSLLGAVVFGRKSVFVASRPSAAGGYPVHVRWSVAFGHMNEYARLSWSELTDRIAAARAGEPLRW